MLLRSIPALTLAVAATLTLAPHAQGPARLNPMIALHEKKLPVFGLTHPAIVPPRPRGAAADVTPPPPMPSLMDAARETVAYRYSDFEYDNYTTPTADRFMGYLAALLRVGGTMSSHAFISKVPILHPDPAEAVSRIHEQLDAGHVGVMLQEVESADEIRAALAAMRFTSKGGSRPESGVGLAAAYWGLSEADYLEKAAPWPLDSKGELVLWAIVESKKGIASIREIAATPGLTVIVVGAGTLGGVFTETRPNGEKVRDQEGFDVAVASVAAACREFKVACSHPANTAEDIQRLTAQGFSVFTMQTRNEAAFAAIAAGRRMAGRAVPPTSR